MLKKCALLICASLYSTTAHAVCNPKEFLAPNTEIITSSSSFNLSQNSEISKERFEELKRNGHLFVSLPKVPLITNIDYDDYKRLVQAEKSNQKLELNQTQTQTIYRSYLPPEAVKAYLGCVENDAVHLDIAVPNTALDQSDFFVTLTWMGPRGEPTGRFDNVGAHHFQIFGGEIPDQADFDKIEGVPNGKPFRVRVKRDLSVPFGFSASVDGSSGEIGLPAKEDPAKLQIDVATSQEQPAYGDGKSNQDNPYCLYAKPDEIFLTSTIQFADRKQLEEGTRAWSTLNQPVNEKAICATAHAVADDSKNVARIWSKFMVVRITTPSR
jgi:hypothetical protein